MTPSAADQKLSLKLDDLAWRDVGDELVVLEVTTTTYLTLNGSARFLWARLVDGATPAELASALVEHYGIPDDQASRDVQSFLDVLRDRSLLDAAS